MAAQSKRMLTALCVSRENALVWDWRGYFDTSPQILTLCTSYMKTFTVLCFCSSTWGHQNLVTLHNSWLQKENPHVSGRGHSCDTEFVLCYEPALFNLTIHDVAWRAGTMVQILVGNNICFLFLWVILIGLTYLHQLNHTFLRRDLGCTSKFWGSWHTMSDVKGNCCCSLQRNKPGWNNGTLDSNFQCARQIAGFCAAEWLEW